MQTPLQVVQAPDHAFDGPQHREQHLLVPFGVIGCGFGGGNGGELDGQGVNPTPAVFFGRLFWAEVVTHVRVCTQQERSREGGGCTTYIHEMHRCIIHLKKHACPPVGPKAIAKAKRSSRRRRQPYESGSEEAQGDGNRRRTSSLLRNGVVGLWGCQMSVCIYITTLNMKTIG